MDNKYYDRLQSRINWVMQKGELTFQEIVRECKGAYPIDVLQVLESQKYLQTEKKVYSYKNLESKSSKEFITGTIENNPILCSWYFSMPTCKKIVDLYSWSNKNILFLGMPRLFEYFINNIKNAIFTLVDLDSYVVNQLKERYDFNENHIIICSDINSLDFKLYNKYDYIFLDPPWYIDDYEKWIAKAYKMLNEKEGILIFSLFQELTRPDAENGRKRLLDKVKEHSREYLAISDFLEYEIPTFEKSELYHCGIELERPWKKADLIIAKEAINKEFDSLKRDNSYSRKDWEEVSFNKIRIFISVHESDKEKDVSIRYLPSNTSYLKNPSKRNIELEMVNMLTSRGQGFIVNSSEKLLSILKRLKIQMEKGIDINIVLDSLDIDDLSKKILYDILKGETC